jgi:hypothetical protein
MTDKTDLWDMDGDDNHQSYRAEQARLKKVDYSTLQPWACLIFGSYNRLEIDTAVSDGDWQTLRILLLNTPLDIRFNHLSAWVKETPFRSAETIARRRIQVTNYVNALKRGGMIK